MDRVEKILMLGVLGVAMAFVAVLAFESGPGPEGTKTDGDERTSIVADGVSEGASGTAQEASSSRSLNEMLGPNVEAGGGSQAEAGEGSDTRGSGTSGRGCSRHGGRFRRADGRHRVPGRRFRVQQPERGRQPGHHVDVLVSRRVPGLPGAQRGHPGRHPSQALRLFRPAHDAPGADAQRGPQPQQAECRPGDPPAGRSAARQHERLAQAQHGSPAGFP
jgi:hypothetical protein